MTGGPSAGFGSDAPAGPRYLIRLDDACATMPRAVWDCIESTLLDAGLAPLVAVIPDNRDPKMLIDDPDPDFWSRVRGWQARGWAIGLHGLHHVMSPRRGHNTEFAGLPAPRQEDLLAAAFGIFSREGVRPDAWMAPNHTFDRTTVRILASRRLMVISDGQALLPYRDSFGVLHVPQQLARFETRAAGVWTVCRHPNGWDSDGLTEFERDVRRFADRVVDLRSVVETYAGRRRDAKDLFFWTRRRAKGAALRAAHGLAALRGSEAGERSE